MQTFDSVVAQLLQLQLQVTCYSLHAPMDFSAPCWRTSIVVCEEPTGFLDKMELAAMHKPFDERDFDGTHSRRFVCLLDLLGCKHFGWLDHCLQVSKNCGETWSDADSLLEKVEEEDLIL